MKWTPQSLFTTILGGRVTIEGISFRIHHSSKLNSNKFLSCIHRGDIWGEIIISTSVTWKLTSNMAFDQSGRT